MIGKGIRCRSCKSLRYLSVTIRLEVDDLGNLVHHSDLAHQDSKVASSRWRMLTETQLLFNASRKKSMDATTCPNHAVKMIAKSAWA